MRVRSLQRHPAVAATIALVLSVATPASSLRAQTQVDRPQPPQIVTTGEGEVQITPDRAHIFVSVETRATTAAAAADDNARRQRAVLDKLRALGIPDAQLGTSGYNVQPEYQYDRNGGAPKVTGYVARNTIRADIRRLDQVGPAIDGALAAGANSIGGLDFYSSRTDDARREALAAAVLQARLDATAMARAAGGSLGPLIEVSSNTMSGPIMQPRFELARTATAVAETPITPGEQTLTVQVTARWQYTAPPR
jgi:hypothetical protein